MKQWNLISETNEKRTKKKGNLNGDFIVFSYTYWNESFFKKTLSIPFKIECDRNQMQNKIKYRKISKQIKENCQDTVLHY